MEIKKNRQDKLFQDLFRLGDHSSWVQPMQIENIDWFTMKRPNFNIAQVYQDESLIKERMTELVKLGANPSNKTYLVANVNRLGLLEHAYELGADPNMLGKTGMSVCSRAISRGRTDIAKITILHPKFDFHNELSSNSDGVNVLLASIKKGRIDLANSILDKFPESCLLKDNNGNSVLDLAAYSLTTEGKPPMSKSLLFINRVCDIHFAKNIIPTSSTISQEINTLVTEKFANKLANEMAPQSDAKSNYKTIKI